MFTPRKLSRLACFMLWLGDLLSRLGLVSSYLNPKPLQPAPLAPENPELVKAQEEFGKALEISISKQIDEVLYGESYYPGKGFEVGSYLYDASIDEVIFLPFYYFKLKEGDTFANQFVFLGRVSDFR